jgi:hypothetical protein
MAHFTAKYAKKSQRTQGRKVSFIAGLQYAKITMTKQE